MLTGALFLTLALLGFGAVGYGVMQARQEDLALLDRRMGLESVVAAAPLRAPRTLVAVPRHLAPLLAQAQIAPTPQLIAAIIGAFALAFALMLALTTLSTAILVLLIAATLLALYVHGRARRRRDALVDALPFYLDGVRQLMSIGNSLPQALQRALPSAGMPVQSFLGGAVRRIELGAPVTEAMQQLADRLAISEIAMLAAAIRVNIRFGGPMTSILGNLAQIVRERLRIKRELASATAEVKVSTQLLVVLPLLLIAFLLFSNPAYRHFFFSDPRGHRLALIAASLQGMGICVMVRMKRMSF